MAFQTGSLDSLPAAPKERYRIGEELQPFGTYAGVIPYLGSIQDAEALQEHEEIDPEFKSADWWWNHQRIRFLNGKLGLKILLLIIPISWVLLLVVGGMALIGWGILEVAQYLSLPGIIVGLLGLILVPSWMLLSFWIARPTTNWIMSTGLGFLLKPFEKTINKKLDKTLEDGCSEFNRLTGQVRIALGRGRFFEAPFVEFDAYIERVIQESGVFYRLMLVHRYTQKTFNKTGFSTIESDKTEVLAMWDMLQRYMDVSQPLPDTPRLEPFRHLDPITAEHDRRTGRNPRYWRDLDLESWKEGEGRSEVYRRQVSYPWARPNLQAYPAAGQDFDGRVSGAAAGGCLADLRYC